MYLLPSLTPKALEEIARQPENTENLVKREAEQLNKLKEIRDYKRNDLTPGQAPRTEESEEEESEVEEEEDDEEEQDQDVSQEEEEAEPEVDADDQSMSDDGFEQLPDIM